MNIQKRSEKYKKSSSKKRGNLKKILMFFMLLFIVPIIFFVSIGKEIIDVVNETNIEFISNKKRDKISKEDSFTFLFIGSKKEKEEEVLTEVLVASSNAKTGKTSIVNFPVDTAFTHHKSLSDAYTLKREGEVFSTCERLLNVSIDRIIKFDFNRIGNLLQATGGVNIQNPKGFSAKGYHFNQGTIHIKNNEEAEAYLTLINDMDHESCIIREQNLTMAVFQNLKKPDTLFFNYKKILKVMSKSVSTDFDLDDLKTITFDFKNALHIIKSNIHTETSSDTALSKIVTDSEMEKVQEWFKNTLS